MRLLRTIIALSIALSATIPIYAASSSADLPHVHVQLMLEQDALYTGAPPNPAALYFKLEPGWHVYWKNPGDAGEPPRIKWTLPQGIAATPLQFPVPKRLPLGPLMDFGYEDEVLFPFAFQVADNAARGSVTLHAKIDWLVCRGSCIPEKTELELHEKVSNGPLDLIETGPLSDRFFHRPSASIPELPNAVPNSLKVGYVPTSTGFRLTVITGKKETEASFFPSKPDILSNPAPQNVTPTASGLTLDLKKDETLSAKPEELTGLLLLSGNRAYELIVPAGAPKPAKAAPLEAGQSVSSATTSTTSSAPVSENASSTTGPVHPAETGLLRAGVLAFLGGLILNLMPCVFPVLFIKGLSLVQSGGEEKHKLRMHGFVYTLGILISFWILVGVLLGLRSAGLHLGWGFQFQSPVFLSLMAALLFFLGLSLAGQFEIGLTLTSAGGSLAAKQGYTGSFFTGVLAVIVATPCTAPFMGVALGYALSQTAVVTFAVFTALALGLAAPYLILTLQPAWTRILPRPGAWMEVLKQAVSMPIFGTVIWLAWVVANAYGAAVLAALLCSFLLLAIAGWFLGRWPAKRWSATVAGVILLGVVCLSVVAPSNLEDPTSHVLNISLTPDDARAISTISRSVSGIWQPWSADAVARYQSQGRPVFVDFTANWCLSCQVNERVALGKPEVKKAFTDANVVLMRADWTRYDDNITRTLNSFGRSGVPTYALYVPGESQPRLLPEVLTPGIVTDAIAQLPKNSTQTTPTSNQQ